MDIRSLPLRNLTRKPARTAALLLLVTFLAFSIFGGSLVVLSLRSGLSSLEDRLGADVIVLPASAKSHVDLESILLQGTPGYFYMDRAYLSEIEGTEGVEVASPQYFLASLSAGCCSMPVQLIGFDPQTDFSIQPWIRQSYGRALEDREVVVGSQVTSAVGSRIRFYDVDCRVVAKLESTGTGLDTAVYSNEDTIQILMEAAREKGSPVLKNASPKGSVSSVYIKVKDGYDVESVANDINIHIRHVQAVPTRSMLAGISDSLSGVSETIAMMIGAIWVLAFVILILAFSMLVNERKKEFAVLRVVGTSRGMLAGMILSESGILSLAGGLLGALLAAVTVLPFNRLIEDKLGLPFLLPGIGTILALAAAAIAAVLVVGPAASAYSAFRLSRVDTGTILREGA